MDSARIQAEFDRRASSLGLSKLVFKVYRGRISAALATGQRNGKIKEEDGEREARGCEEEEGGEKKAKNERGGADTQGDGAKRSGRLGIETGGRGRRKICNYNNYSRARDNYKSSLN